MSVCPAAIHSRARVDNGVIVPHCPLMIADANSLGRSPQCARECPGRPSPALAGPATVLSFDPGATTTSVNPAAAVRRPWRQSKSDYARPQTDAPGATASATIDCFCSGIHRRRRSGPDSTPKSAHRTVSCIDASESACAVAKGRRIIPARAGGLPQFAASAQDRLWPLPNVLRTKGTWQLLQPVPNRDLFSVCALIRYQRLERLRLGLTFWGCVGNARWTRALCDPRAPGRLAWVRCSSNNSHNLAEPLHLVPTAVIQTFEKSTERQGRSKLIVIHTRKIIAGVHIPCPAKEKLVERFHSTGT
jgi:hypothetical protein